MKMSKSIIYYLTQYWEDGSDQRTRHLLMVDMSPLIVLWLFIGYIAIAKIIGPQLMKNREPFQLREIMLLYNTIMALFNGIAFVKSLTLCDYGRRLLNFEYPDRDDMSDQNILEIHLYYCYWLTKFLDLMDTVFFVLRKKYSQITLLHLYHHSIVPIIGCILYNINPLIPGCILFAIINSFIHVVMYSYYALSAMGPNIQKYLWWKRYITVMQLWQFVIYAVYAGFLFLFQTNYPMIFLYIGLTQPPLFFWLFYDFYVKAYQSQRKSRVNDRISLKDTDKTK